MQCSDYQHNILSYLLRNPEAQDTVEGIVEWWLIEERVRFVAQEASRALAELVAQGWVLARKHPDGRIRFRLNPARMGEIGQRLENPRRGARSRPKRDRRA